MNVGTGQRVTTPTSSSRVGTGWSTCGTGSPGASNSRRVSRTGHVGVVFVHVEGYPLGSGTPEIWSTR